MGAGGCLGPKKLKNEVYVQLITEMHNNAHRVSYSQNLDIYTVIKQRMTKKGQLRKFIDNLSSHRNRILESLNFNYKLTTQTKEMQRHYVGLIINDAIVDLVYPNSSNAYVPHKDIHHQDDLLESSFSSNNNSYTKKAEQTSKRSKHYKFSSPKKQYQFCQQSKALYDEQYFKLINFLYENEKRIHHRLLESIMSFCIKHKGIINCDRYVSKLVQKMTQNINRNIFLDKSCKVLNLILLRTRDQFIEQMKDCETLITLFTVWLRQKQEIQSKDLEVQVNCYQIIEIYFSLCISSWDSMFLYEAMFRLYDQLEFQKIKLHLLEKMVEEILRNHDLKFHFFRGLFNYLLGYLSVTPENMMGETDRKWFATSLGLNYQKMLSQHKNVLKDTVKTEAFKLLNRWINKKYTDIDQFCMYNTKALIFVYISNAKYYHKTKSTLQVILDEYFKIINKLNKENRQLFKERIFEDFREQGLAQIEYELLLKLIKQMLYKEEHMYFTSNKEQGNSYQHKSVNHQKSTSFKKTQSKHDVSTLKAPLTPIAVTKTSPFNPQLMKFQNIHSNHEIEQNQSFVTIPTSEQLSQNMDIYLTPILTIYNKDIKLQILKIIGYVFQKIQQIKLNEDGKIKLCELFYSIYENIVISSLSIHQKYEFACAVISVLRLMIIKSPTCSIFPTLTGTSNNKSMISNTSYTNNKKSLINCRFLLKAFIFKIYKEITERCLRKTGTNIRSLQLNMSVQSQYILLYLIYEIKNMLGSNIPHDNYSSAGSQTKKSGIFVTNKKNFKNCCKTDDQIKERSSRIKQEQETGYAERVKQKMNRINTKMTIFYNNRHQTEANTSDMSYYYDEGLTKYQSELLLDIQSFVREYEDEIRELNEPRSSQIESQVIISEVKRFEQKQNRREKSEQDKNIMKQLQIKQEQQYQQYLSIFMRLFSPCPLSHAYNGEATNRSRMNSKDSDATSLFAFTRKNSTYYPGNHSNTKNFRESDQSFQEVLDIVHV